MNQLPNLTDHELHQVIFNALALAREQYENNAAQINGDIDAGKLNGMAWRPIADQFRKQAHDCGALLDKLEGESRELA